MRLLLTSKQLVLNSTDKIVSGFAQTVLIFGFLWRLGKCLTPTTHGAMGFLVNSSPNLLMALKAFQAFMPTRISLRV